MFFNKCNQWKCACVGINNWVILLRARYKCNHVYYPVYKSPFDSILNHINSVKTFVHYICNIHLKTIISSLCKSSICSPTFKCTNQCLLRSYVISDTFCMTHHAIALNLVPWMISGKGHKFWNSSPQILPELLVTSRPILAHIPPSALFPNTNKFVLILVRYNFARPSEVTLSFTFQSLQVLKGGRMTVGS